MVTDRPATGYSSREIAKLLDLPVSRVRSYAQAGLVTPRRGPRNEYRFSFQDLVLLRTARDLLERRIPPRKVRRALSSLRGRLPRGRSLAEMRICASGNEVVVRSRGQTWNPESGQICLDFEVSELARKVAPLVRRAAHDAFSSSVSMDAEEWFDLGCELEPADPARARQAYRQVLEQAPEHTEAHINLGRLLHAAGETSEAEAHYRLALAVRPDDSTALFNLGVVLEDMGRPSEAMAAYKRAIAGDPGCADAHFNLAYLYEKQDNRTAALQHFNQYRKLLRNRT